MTAPNFRDPCRRECALFVLCVVSCCWYILVCGFLVAVMTAVCAVYSKYVLFCVS